MDVGDDGLPLLKYDDFFEYLMRWTNSAGREGFIFGGEKLNLLCSPQQMSYARSTKEFVHAVDGFQPLTFNLPMGAVTVIPVTGHRGLTLTPAGEFVIPGPRGGDSFHLVKLTLLLKLEGCRPGLPKEGFGFTAKNTTAASWLPKPLPSTVNVAIREARVTPIMPDYPLRTAQSYHHEINNRMFIFQLQMARANDTSFTEVVFDLDDPFRRVREPDGESVVLANLRANEAEW